MSPLPPGSPADTDIQDSLAWGAPQTTPSPGHTSFLLAQQRPPPNSTSSYRVLGLRWFWGDKGEPKALRSASSGGLRETLGWPRQGTGVRTTGSTVN